MFSSHVFGVSMRCFVAFEIFGDVRSTVLSVQEKLPVHKKIVLVTAENLHCTLKFIGDINEQTIKSIKHSLHDIVCTRESMRCSLDGVGAFPSIEHARIVWIGVAGEGISNLQRIIESGLEKCGVPIDLQEFHPHITLARIKSLEHCKSVCSVIKQLKNFSTKEFDVNSIKLKMSILTPQGPKYTNISSFSFR